MRGPLLLIWIGLIVAGSHVSRAQTPAEAPETPGLKATQVTVAIEKDNKRRQFRATVLARIDDDVTILTAAHCLSEDDKDGPVLLIIDGSVIEGSVASVVRNPAYRTNQNREIPGADNALAKLRMKHPSNTPAVEAFRSLKSARGISSRAYPGPDGQTVAVHMIDGHGVEHALKAGNHRNPRYLEWGASYKPIPGDSGGGVFVIREAPEGEPHAILIGVIVGRDDRGGAASLVSQEMRWITEELSRQ